MQIWKLHWVTNSPIVNLHRQSAVSSYTPGGMDALLAAWRYTPVKKPTCPKKEEVQLKNDLEAYSCPRKAE